MSSRFYILMRLLIAAVSMQSVALAAESEDKRSNPKYEDKNIKVRVMSRTTEQMAAFYEGRGFPQNALEKVKNACFMTVIINNISDTVIWLELKNWQLLPSNTEIERLDRNHWKQQWKNIDLPMANQSTFGWTLMPEKRDLQPDESVGGNVTFTQSKRIFAIKMKFDTGQEKNGDVIDVQINEITCNLNNGQTK